MCLRVLFNFLISVAFVQGGINLQSSINRGQLTNEQEKNINRHLVESKDFVKRHIRTVIQQKMTLFDFTTMENVNEWFEISDTVRTVGKSKADFVLQKTQQFQRAIFFTLLNPQPNGACFAGIHVPVNFNLTDFESIEITCRGQGNNSQYKVVLNDEQHKHNNSLVYEQFFTVPMSNESFSTVKLPLRNFKLYYRGQEIQAAEPLDTANIVQFGLQMFGGVYLPFKQSGVSALEIENISAVS